MRALPLIQEPSLLALHNALGATAWHTAVSGVVLSLVGPTLATTAQALDLRGTFAGLGFNPSAEFLLFLAGLGVCLFTIGRTGLSMRGLFRHHPRLATAPALMVVTCVVGVLGAVGLAVGAMILPWMSAIPEMAMGATLEVAACAMVALRPHIRMAAHRARTDSLQNATAVGPAESRHGSGQRPHLIGYGAQALECVLQATEWCAARMWLFLSLGAARAVRMARETRVPKCSHRGCGQALEDPELICRCGSSSAGALPSGYPRPAAPFLTACSSCHRLIPTIWPLRKQLTTGGLAVRVLGCPLACRAQRTAFDQIVHVLAIPVTGEALSAWFDRIWGEDHRHPVRLRDPTTTFHLQFEETPGVQIELDVAWPRSVRRWVGGLDAVIWIGGSADCITDSFYDLSFPAEVHRDWYHDATRRSSVLARLVLGPGRQSPHFYRRRRPALRHVSEAQDPDTALPSGVQRIAPTRDAFIDLVRKTRS